MARGKVDKAQNELMKQMKKKLDELDDTVETKYNVITNRDAVQSYDGSTTLTRADQIVSLPMGSVQGTADFNQRVGDQVTFKHIDFNYRLNLDALRGPEETQASTSIRVMLFWDSQPSAITTAGALAVNPVYWPQLLQNAPLGVTNNIQKTQAILSQKDWDNRKRFQIVYDKIHTLSSNYTIASTTQNSSLGPRATTGVASFSKNYNGQKIRFVAGGSTVQNRQLYLAYLSDVGINPTATTQITRPIIDYNIRLLYEDA